MPKIVDYGARMDLVAEATCVLAARSGGAAVTVPAVAEELGLSVSSVRRCVASTASLESLAVRLLERKRMSRLLTRGRPDVGEQRAAREVGALLRLLPADEEEVAEERAWRALSGGSEPSALVAEAKGARDVVLELAIRELLVAIGAPAPEQQQQRLRALVDGLLVGLCERRLDIAEATTLVVSEVSLLATGDPGGSGPRG
jgi:AcrR family transcriptional regulator